MPDDLQHTSTKTVGEYPYPEYVELAKVGPWSTAAIDYFAHTAAKDYSPRQVVAMLKMCWGSGMNPYTMIDSLRVLRFHGQIDMEAFGR